MASRQREILKIFQLLVAYGDRAVTAESLEDSDTVSILQGSIELWKSQLDRLQDLLILFGDGEVDEHASLELGDLKSLFIQMRKYLCALLEDMSVGVGVLSSCYISGCVGVRPSNFYSIADTETGVFDSEIQSAETLYLADSDKSGAKRLPQPLMSIYSSKKEYSNFQSVFGSLSRNIENVFWKLLQLLQGQAECLTSLTHLLLWTAYEEDLYRTLLASNIDGSVPGSVLTVFRKVLTDKSRLSKTQQRMIAANCRRRSQFINARCSADTLNEPRATQISQVVSKSTKTIASQPQAYVGIPGGLGKTILSSETATLVSDFVVTRMRPSNKLATPGGGWDYPSLPKTRSGAEGFICPFCGNLLNSTIANSIKFWRQHVLNDVLPYTCIFNECSTPFVFYSSAKSWLTHMEHEHSGRQWTCYGCSPSEPRIFDSRQEYLQHFESTRQHVGTTTKPQIEVLAQLNETPRPLKFTSCPLCRWTEGSDMESFVGKSMQGHIADHIFSFAMLSLPLDAELDSDSQVPSTGRQFAPSAYSELSFELESLSTLEFHSETDQNSVRGEKSDDELNEGVESGALTRPPIPVEDPTHIPVSEERRISNLQYSGSKILLLGASKRPSIPLEDPTDFPVSEERRDSSLLYSRWRKVLLLGAAIASFLAAGRRLRARLMCVFCEDISRFFENLDTKVSYKVFAHHQNRQNMYISARTGCSLCKTFIKAAFGETEGGDYEVLGPDTQDDKATPFFLVFLGKDVDKRLQMWVRSDPQKLLNEFEIYCARDGALSRLNWTKYRPLFTDPSSEEALEFLLERLQICCRKHDRCRRTGMVSPTRLLYVGDPIAIVEPHQDEDTPPKFLYLSACWGRDFAVRLTRSNYSDLRTEIVLERLPKTIRDAILVARALQIPYIWVDSLCIVQDEVDDWLVEAGRLKDYLLSCTFTLGAASSPSLATGFLNFRDDQRCYTFSAHTVGSLPGAKVHLRPSLPPVWDSISRDPLLSRLWTLQELTVCSRSISFGSSTIVWNCRTSMVSDASESEMPPIWTQRLGLDMLLDPSDAFRDEKLPMTSQGQDLEIASSIRSSSNSDESIYKSWQRIVEYSSQLKVTFEIDRLPALSALASITKEKLHQDIYMAGLWRNNLHRDLLWHRADATLKKTAGSGVPSWSWAAYVGRISYSIQHLLGPCVTDAFEDTLEPLAKIVQVGSLGKSSDPFGELHLGWVETSTYYIGYDELVKIVDSEPIKGHATWLVQMDLYDETSIKGLQLSIEPSETEVDPKIDTEEGGEKTTYQPEAIEKAHDLAARAADQELTQKIAKSQQPSMPPQLTILFISTSYSDDWRMATALLVEPGEDQTFQRVGVGILRWTGSNQVSDFISGYKTFELV